MLYQCAQKKGTFVDELLTYDLSNRQSSRVEYILSYLASSSPSAIWNDVNDVLQNGKEASRIYLDFKEFEKQSDEASSWHEGTYFAGFITAEKGHRFDFFSVIYNALYDSAPPFYYFLVHFICSLFPGSFSLWYGLVINLIFLMLTCALLYHLTEKFFGGTKYACLVTLCYALSIGGISTLLIIRMYAVYTFLTLAFFGVNLYIAGNDFTFTKKSRIAYILCAVLGFYTQYYFVIYAGFLVGTVLVFLFFGENFSRKKYRAKAKAYIAPSVIAAVISLIIWPFSIKHIFMDSFGASTFSNAASGNLFQKLAAYLNILIDSLFVGQPLLFVFLCLLLLTGIIVLLFCLRSRKLSAQFSFTTLKPFLLFIPSLGYLFLVALSAPFYADRYIMCIFPFCLLGIYYLYSLVLSAFSKHTSAAKSTFPILCAAGAAITLYGLLAVPKNYVYPDRNERYAFMENAENAVCLYVSEDNGWMYKSCLDIMSLCKGTAMLYPEQISSGSDMPKLPDDYDKVLVCIANSFEQEDILNALIECYHLENRTIIEFSSVNDEYAKLYLVE